MKNEIKLSVIIISYNQEKYIKDALESVLNQKVNFKYELLLADDCSKDSTKKIMEEYQKKYPDIIKVLERKKNLGATKNLLDACSKTKGEYITLLEGDDYWIDENKLQMQIEFLENHSDYIGVSHLQQGRDLENNIVGNFPKAINSDCEITMNDFINGKIYSSTATLYKNIYIDNKHKKNIEYLFNLDPIIGDAQLCMYLLNNGKIKVFSKAMMVYRMRHSKGEVNYNSTHSFSQIKMSYLNIYLKMDDFFQNKYDFYNKYKECVSQGLVYSIITFHFKEAKEFIKKCPKKYRMKIILITPFSVLGFMIKRFRK